MDANAPYWGDYNKWIINKIKADISPVHVLPIVQRCGLLGRDGQHLHFHAFVCSKAICFS